MKILILGGSGFIGTRLTELLINAHDVTIGDIAPSEKYPQYWRKCDVCSDDDLRKVLPGHDCIVNLAAAHRDDVRPLSLYEKTNVEGAKHVCKIASECKIKLIVFTSSVAIYGFPQWAYDEDAPKTPFNEYGRTKLAAESVYKNWQESDRGNCLHIIRPTVVFGERNRGNVYNLFKQLASGRFLMVGNGKNKKSMAYVGNIAAFLAWNIDKNQAPYSVYNYIDKPDYDMNSLVFGFEKIMDRKLPPIRLPYWLGLLAGYAFDVLAFITRKRFPISSIRIKKFCAQTVFDSSRMMASGFTAPFDMEEALKKTIDFEFIEKSGQNKN